MKTLGLASLLVLFAVPSSRSNGTEPEDYWQAVRTARETRPRFNPAEHLPEADRAFLARLEEERIEGVVIHEEENLARVLKVLSTTAGVPVLADPWAEHACYDEGLLFELNLANPIPVADALDLVAEQAGADVSWRVRDGVVLFDVHDYTSDKIIFVHSVIDLLLDPRKFNEPEASIAPLFTPLEQDDLATLVQENVTPGRWDDEGVLMQISAGFLTIVHTAEVHAETEVFLDFLRSFFCPLPSEGSPGREIGYYPDSDPVGATIRARLAEVRVAARFGSAEGGAPLEEVAAFLGQATGINFALSNYVRYELDEERSRVSMEVPERSVRELLDLVVEVTRGISWRVRDGIVEFIAAHEGPGGQVFALHDIRHLVFPVAPGWDEDDVAVIDADSLDTLVRDTIAPNSWDENPANLLRITPQGVIFLNQTPAVHAQIEALLEHLSELSRLKQRVFEITGDRLQEY